MNNPFENGRAATVAGPGRDYLPIAPNDVSDLPQVGIALYAETGGTVVFDSVAGATRTVAVPDFGWVLCGVRKVHATGTTALGLHAVTLS